MAVTLTSTGITFSDGSTQNAAASGGGAGGIGLGITTSGSGSITVPAGVNSAYVTGAGAGAGAQAGACGGTGASAWRAKVAISEGTNVSWSIGTPGNHYAGNNGHRGNSGNATTFANTSLGGGYRGNSTWNTQGANGGVASGFSGGWGTATGPAGNSLSENTAHCTPSVNIGGSYGKGACNTTNNSAQGGYLVVEWGTD